MKKIFLILLISTLNFVFSQSVKNSISVNFELSQNLFNQALYQQFKDVNFLHKEFSSSNYPNPFNPSTTINYSLPEQQSVKIAIYNSLGQEVKILENSTKKAGNYKIRFNPKALSSGIYYCTIKTKEYSKTIKLLFLK